MTTRNIPGARRKKLLWPTIFIAAFFTILARRYLFLTFNILIRGPYIATYHSEHLQISPERDHFDITFESYPNSPPFTTTSEYPQVVPAIIHNIRLGSNNASNLSVELQNAHQTCVDMHPGYEFILWDDVTAAKFVKEYYPALFYMWSNYRYVIQKADSLRYMILYVHGGIFLDLDLECRRPLDPLRRFSFVAPAATPMGISNGFIMTVPQNPFLKFALSHLEPYNLKWFGLPYAIVMFSTGCHFLSTMLSIYPFREEVKVLWGPNGMHKLSGPVTTPLFRHLGLSSWHSSDGAIFKHFRKNPQAHGFGLMINMCILITIIYLCNRLYRSRYRMRRASLSNKKIDLTV